MPASIVFLQQRRQHDALDALIVGIGRKKVNWILDADIRSFFDSVSHDGLVRFLQHRHSDERILRMIRKLAAGRSAGRGIVTEGEIRTLQGATASPLLANDVLDL